MNKLAPIVLFVYNRLWHTKQVIEALQKNELADVSELFIYSDYAKNENQIEKINEVRSYIKKISAFKKITIIEREKNWGCANSIIDGITNIINIYGKVIIVEDDIVTSKYFLKYMNEALNYYKDNNKVMHISGFTPPISILEKYKKDTFFITRISSWGWATWKTRWKLADWEMKYYNDFIKNEKMKKEFNKCGNDLSEMLTLQKKGEIDAWDIRWDYTIFKNKGLTLYSKTSYVKNIGFDNSGVHSVKSDEKKFKVKKLKNNDKIKFEKIPVKDENITKAIKKHYSTNIVILLLVKLKKNLIKIINTIK